MYFIFKLFFSAPPRITLDPQFQMVRPGDDASIYCSASGDSPIRIGKTYALKKYAQFALNIEHYRPTNFAFPYIEWAKEGQPYLPRSVFASNGQLQFQEISSEDQGRYVCTASNPLGTSEATAEVVVSSELQLILLLFSK